MDDYLKELSEIPWINVIESCRAYDEYECPEDVKKGAIGGFVIHRIMHIAFAIGAIDQKCDDLLVCLGRKAIFGYIFDTIMKTDKLGKYPWYKKEGETIALLSKSDMKRILLTSEISIREIEAVGKSICREDRLWFSIRRPWEIEQSNENSIMFGRFGCGIFHKDAKRVEAKL